MILQALAQYYERKRSADPAALPEPGFERKEIPFLIVLSADGRFLNIEDTREGEGKKRRGRKFTVPHGSRTSGIVPRLLWDDFRYVLGISPVDASEREVRRTAECRNAFLAHLEETFGSHPQDEGVTAVATYLRARDFAGVQRHSLFAEIQDNPRQLVSFRLASAPELIAERPFVVDRLRSASAAGESAQCLVTGRIEATARIHPKIKGIKDRPGTQAEKSLVSFNTDTHPAFGTHGREQGANAPVSQRAAFAYTTALNRLLDRDSRLKAVVGDTTVVFWAAAGNPVEDLAGALFQDAQAVLDDPEVGVEKLRAIYNAPWQGHPPLVEDRSRFYVLGLAPNAGRIAIRFWRPTTVSAFAGAVLQHFADVELARPHWLPKHPSVSALLRSTAMLGKDDNIPPNLAGTVLDAIVTGGPYPRTLLSAAVQRVRAQPKADSVTEDARLWADRAAVIKACLIRTNRYASSNPKEVQVSLDQTNHNIGYLLGRLFAALERAQETASPGIQSGIRERYYASASATPTAAFPTLMKLKNHHLAKIENRGAAVNLERLLGAILDGISDFPSVLSLPDQGRFALGYYHQRQTFFTKADNPEERSHD